MNIGMLLGECAVNCFGGDKFIDYFLYTVTVFFIKEVQTLELPQVSLSRTSSGEENTKPTTISDGFHLYRV